MIPYVQKYSYANLSKVSKDGKRYYTTPDGALTKTVPSVTTILSATKDMTHLYAWRKK